MGKSFERQAVNTRPEALLDRPDRPFDLANVTVGGDDIEEDGEYVVTEAFEFVVGVNVAHK